MHSEVEGTWIRPGNSAPILLLAMCLCLLTQSRPTFCDPMDCSPSGSSVHEIFQARILKWVAISYSKASSRLRDWTSVSWVSCIADGFFTHWAIRKAPLCSPWRFQPSIATWQWWICCQWGSSQRAISVHWYFPMAQNTCGQKQNSEICFVLPGFLEPLVLT